MFKRVLSLFFVLMLMVGGAAACGDDSGDDDGGGGGGSSEDSEGGGGGGGETGGGNAEVQAYCDSVQEFVDASAALADDPTDAEAQQTVTDLSTQLGADAAELAQSLQDSPEDLEEFQACQTDFSSVTP